MLRRANGVLKMCQERHTMHLFAAETDGTAEEEAEDRRDISPGTEPSRGFHYAIHVSRSYAGPTATALSADTDRCNTH